MKVVTSATEGEGALEKCDSFRVRDARRWMTPATALFEPTNAFSVVISADALMLMLMMLMLTGCWTTAGGGHAG